MQVWILFKAAQPFSLLLSLCIALSFFAYMYSTVAALHGCCNYFAGSTLISIFRHTTYSQTTLMDLHFQQIHVYMYICKKNACTCIPVMYKFDTHINPQLVGQQLRAATPPNSTWTCMYSMNTYMYIRIYMHWLHSVHVYMASKQRQRYTPRIVFSFFQRKNCPGWDSNPRHSVF